MEQRVFGYQDKSNLFKIRHSVLFDSPEWKNLPMHIHSHYEILYLLEGDISFYIEGRTYKMQPGDIVIMNNKELHAPIPLSKSRFNRIVIEFFPSYLEGLQTPEYDLFKAFEKRLPGSRNLIRTDDAIKHNIKKMIQRIINLSFENKPETSLLVKVELVNVLVEINRIFEQKNNDDVASDNSNIKIIQVIDYLNKLINSNEDKLLNLDVLASKFYVNKHYLCHLFKKATGFTIWNYIIYKKVMKARDLMMFNNEMTIMNICTECGFDNYSYFYRQFKKIVGVSPKEFMKNINQTKLIT